MFGILLVSVLILGCIVLLGGCASRRWMPFPQRNELKRVTRTVVYVEPQGGLQVSDVPNPALLYASGAAGSEAGYYAVTGFMGFPASVFIYPALYADSDISSYSKYQKDVKPYLPQLENSICPDMRPRWSGRRCPILVGPGRCLW